MQEKFNFPFKAARQYIHGTTIFDAFIQQAQSGGYPNGIIDIFFKKIVTCSACVIEQREPRPDDSVVARITSEDGQSTTYCLEVKNGCDKRLRFEYDEDAVCKGAEIAGQSITIQSPTHSKEIELFVALCKALHLSIFDKRQWLFSRYTGTYPLVVGGPVKIEVVKRIGTKLTCSEVYSDNRKVGEIFFS